MPRPRRWNQHGRIRGQGKARLVRLEDGLVSDEPARVDPETWAAAQEAVREARKAVDAQVAQGSGWVATGYCQRQVDGVVCGRPVTGERRYCGVHLGRV